MESGSGDYCNRVGNGPVGQESLGSYNHKISFLHFVLQLNSLNIVANSAKPFSMPLEFVAVQRRSDHANRRKPDSNIQEKENEGSSVVL